MKTLIVVNSHKGNTRQVADGIAEQLRWRGTCEVVDLDDAGPTIDADVDLLLVGGPTESHGMTPEMRSFLDGLAPTTVRGKARHSIRVSRGRASCPVRLPMESPTSSTSWAPMSSARRAASSSP